MSKTLQATEYAQDRARSIYRGYTNYVGGKIISLLEDTRGLGALTLITLGVAVTKWRTSPKVIHPMVRRQISKSGFDLLPMILFLALALGMAVIGQSVILLNRYGAQNFLGVVMVSVIVRELGPLLAALLVLARIGTANVVELGTARALNEVEALEAVGIDPVHYLILPRVIGISLAVFALTMYLIFFALLSGYLFAFLEGVPLLPGDYFRELSNALMWQDFVLLGLKTLSFGCLVAMVTCFHGLSQRLRLEHVSRETTSAVARCVVGVILVDAIFIIVYRII